MSYIIIAGGSKMRKVMIIGCFLAAFLLLMVPNVSAIEYNHVEETQKTTINEYIGELKEKINSGVCKKQISFLKESLKNSNITELKETIILSLMSFREIVPLDDPGDGEDCDGPDDWTDWMYFLLFFLLWPITFSCTAVVFFCIMLMALILPWFYLVQLITWAFSNNVVALKILKILGKWINIFDIIAFDSIMLLIPSIFIVEFFDEFDWDEDGR